MHTFYVFCTLFTYKKFKRYENYMFPNIELLKLNKLFKTNSIFCLICSNETYHTAYFGKWSNLNIRLYLVKHIEADMLELFCGGSFICEIFLFDFTWTVVIYGRKEDITKMVKLLACFIDVTGKYYFHFMHDMMPHHWGFEKLMGCKVPPSEAASWLSNCILVT